MAWVGRDLKDHPVPMGKGCHQVVQGPTSRDGASTASLGKIIEKNCNCYVVVCVFFFFCSVKSVLVQNEEGQLVSVLFSLHYSLYSVYFWPAVGLSDLCGSPPSSMGYSTILGHLSA